MKPMVITFAGPIGSSKTPIAHHLGWNLGIPLFNTDIVRTEFTEDRRSSDRAEFLQVVGERIRSALKFRRNIIIDASIDRLWEEYKKEFLAFDFRLVVISMDISLPFLRELYQLKKYYFDSDEIVLNNYNEHQEFLRNFADDVSLSITDENFDKRLNLSLEYVQRVLTSEN